MSYKVAIKKNDTGEIRIYTCDVKWHDYSVFWWTEGNMGCDCNLHDCFISVNDPDADEDIECSWDRYTPLYAILEDGIEVKLETIK